jgi:hypothetical protein
MEWVSVAGNSIDDNDVIAMDLDRVVFPGVQDELPGPHTAKDNQRC